MRALEANITVLDFESTGSVDGYDVEPWQIGMVRVRQGSLDQTDTVDRFLQVGDRPFNPRAPGRYARVRDKLRAAPRLPELWPELQPWLHRVPLAAHNIGTEKGFLRTAAPLHRFGPWIDTLKLSRIAYPDLPSHALEDLVPQLGLDATVREACPDREPHDALFDAVACAVLLQHLLHSPGWEAFTVEHLSRLRPDRYYRRRRS